MSRVRCTQRVWLMNGFFWPIRGEKSWFFMNLKTPLGSEKHSKTHAWTSGKTPVLRERSSHMTRRAVVSRVIRVQRRYAVQMTRRAVVSRVIRVQRRYTVQIRPIWSGDLVNFGWIFELFIELYGICTYFSYIEYILRIHLVKISLIFIKYEPSTVHPKGSAHAHFFWTHTWWKIMIFFYEFETPSCDLRTIRHHIPEPLEKRRSFTSFASCDSWSGSL